MYVRGNRSQSSGTPQSSVFRGYANLGIPGYKAVGFRGTEAPKGMDSGVPGFGSAEDACRLSQREER